MEAKKTFVERSGSVIDMNPSSKLSNPLIIDNLRGSYGGGFGDNLLSRRVKSKASISQLAGTEKLDLKMPAITDRNIARFGKLNNIKNIYVRKDQEPIFVKFERFGKDFD